MSGNVTKYFNLKQTAGDANLGMLLHDSTPTTSWYQGRSQALRNSDSGGAGASESFTLNTVTSDDMGLVVFNNPGQTSTATWTLYVDDTPPSGTILIDGGAASTTTTSVTLTLSGVDADTGVGRMRIGNNGEPWDPWEPYSTSKPWTLTAGVGSRTVWVQYENNALHQGGVFPDTIELPEPGFAVSMGSGTLLLACLNRLRRRRRAEA